MKDVRTKRVDSVMLYRESPMWQGLAATSRSSTSLPVVVRILGFVFPMFVVTASLCDAGYRLISLLELVMRTDRGYTMCRLRG